MEQICFHEGDDYRSTWAVRSFLLYLSRICSKEKMSYTTHFHRSDEAYKMAHKGNKTDFLLGSDTDGKLRVIDQLREKFLSTNGYGLVLLKTVNEEVEFRVGDSKKPFI